MDMQPVISSNIAQAGYDEKSKTMRVQFLSGGTYDATGVGQADYDAFMASKSKGQHFNKILKTSFVWAKMEKKG